MLSKKYKHGDIILVKEEIEENSFNFGKVLENYKIVNSRTKNKYKKCLRNVLNITDKNQANIVICEWKTGEVTWVNERNIKLASLAEITLYYGK